MAFTKKIPEWNASGVEPPQSLKDSGWKPGVKPAADHFNWLQTTASEAIKELQQKAGEVKTVNGQLPDTNGNVNVNVDTSGFVTTQTFDEHKADGTAHGIGDKTTLKTTEKSTIVGAVNELFTSVSSGKTQVANAITAKGQTASGNDTFAQLATAIDNIDTGKKLTNGTVTSEAAQINFPAYNGTQTGLYYVKLDTSILGFTPREIFLYRTDKSSITTTTWRKDNFYVVGSNNANCALNGGFYKIPFLSGVMNIPVGVGSVSFSWEATE